MAFDPWDTFGILGKKEQFKSTLNPEQTRVNALLGQGFDQSLQGPQYYSGEMTAPISQEETTALGNANQLSGISRDRLSAMISGDKSFDENFQNEIANPSYRDFNLNVKPLIEESLPTFSTERGRAIERGAMDVSNNLLQQRFAAREAEKDRALKAIAAGDSLSDSDVARAGIPRAITQAGLDRQFAKYVQGNAEYQQHINSALNFLGIETQSYIPGRDPLDVLIALGSTAVKAGAAGAPAPTGGA